MDALDATSVVIASARWLLSASAMLVIGHLGAHLVWTRAGAQPPESQDSAPSDKSLVHSTVLLVSACVALLAAQAYAWSGVAGFTDLDILRSLVGSRWGQSWQLTTASGLAAVLVAAAIQKRPAHRTSLLVVIAAGVAAAVPVIGHGGGFGSGNWLMHAVHLLGAGLWLGTLAVLLRIAWPKLAATDRPGKAVAALLARFSPIALSSAAIVTVTGLIVSTWHLGSFAALFASGYGRVLLLKLTAVAVVVVFGWINWRRHAVSLGDDDARGALWRGAWREVLIAFLAVIGLTAWLSGLATP